MISRTYFQENFYDLDVEIASRYAQAIREAWLKNTDFEGEKKKGFFLSKRRGFDDKLYVGNIHRIENHLYWNDEELADDDEIVNVVVIDGPVTRDGDGCSYGSKDHRDQIMYANTIPQVKGHIFILNTPGGAASSRIDYEQAIADCREKGKATVAWVDGMCCSAGQLVASLCDRTIVMNGRNTMGCIGTMCAFWGVAHNTVDKDGYRYIELVSVTSPDKNAEYREAVDGNTEKLQAELDRLGEEFRETVRQNRPLVKEEHLTGKTFDAQEVMGELVDEIGDYNRAIECVFELADEKIVPARSLTPAPSPNGEGSDGPEEHPEEQKNLSTLNDQQKAAVAANAGATMIVDDGHVKVSVDTMFGSVEKEVATPKNDSTMTDEEKKAAEAEAAKAAEQEEEAATESQPTEQEAEVPSTEETPATEEKPAAEEASAAEEEPSGEAPSDSPGGGGQDNANPQNKNDMKKEEEINNTEKTEEQEVPSESPEGQEAPSDSPGGGGQENDKMREALKSAESLVEQKDKEIAEKVKEIDDLRSQLSDLNSQLSSKDETISNLQQQVNDLSAEIKELADKPTPMTNAESGVPADNGTGEGRRENAHQLIKPGMTYAEIRALRKQQGK